MKKFMLLICLCLSCITLNAQKWYSSVSTGCDTYTNLYKDLKFGKTLAPTAAIAVGRDHNPYLGTSSEGISILNCFIYKIIITIQLSAIERDGDLSFDM